MSDSAAQERVRQLVDRLLDETITPEQHQELQSLLKADQGLQDFYLRQIEIDSAMRECLSLAQSDPEPPLISPRGDAKWMQSEDHSESDSAGGRPTLAWTIAAIATSLLIGMWLFSFDDENPGARNPGGSASDPLQPGALSQRQAVSVATLMMSEGCRWDRRALPGQRSAWPTGQTSVRNGTPLQPGRLRLLEGTAVVRFQSGAAVVLDQNCDLELVSRGLARVHHGQMTVHVPDEAIGFTLLTPTGEVEDRGTEFRLDVKSSGATEVHVLDGEVLARFPQASADSKTLVKGQSIRVDTVGLSTVNSVPVKGESFVDQVHQAIDQDPGSVVLYESFDTLRPPADISQGAAPDAVSLRSKKSGPSSFGWSGQWQYPGNMHNGLAKTSTIGKIEVRRADAADSNSSRAHPFGTLHPSDDAKASYLRFSQGRNLMIREMVRPIDFRSDQELFVSFVIRRGGLASAASPPPQEDDVWKKKIHESLRVTFRSQDNYWGPSVSLNFSSSGRPLIGLGNNDSFASAARFVRNGPLLWVTKIQTRDQQSDKVWARVYEADEPIHLIEPTVWTCMTEDFWSDAILDLAIITGSGPQEQFFDELRVGTSWPSVLPSIPVRQ
ncbi:FecR family protein [Stieleria sp. TO1_6]|uniref:FecR family protein n=1 Tax=Stieleria tagensis TaxID=2956795 RepID=UPI00209A9940|nr:FecR family protein [Stieleria tagensis]MCO8122393.1 FecR family protein [Stieleria tagensis]